MYTIKNMFTKTDWTDEGPKHTYTFEFDFNGKEDYLKQTAGWKAAYKELTRTIRKYKGWRKPSNRPDNVPEYHNQHSLLSLKTEAREMCQMRVQAKAHAGRQMVEQRQAA